ncbi:polyphosphate kinase 1 [Paraferrimonas sedimenticola]|uniref:Polyphosphate kinase n=1 Tax=Paraferrimonas sedimenticola TaxID=375674 RepID=A0AA37VT58_9GAMM|nr:polyphosphate kinase 1 [Paraferrimonas sedimenticola]GLP95214.1 polyphosphate kinase [Paraferrimonas sedimenticola]
MDPAPSLSVSEATPRVEKEISWLSFNERVLQEAADPSVPVVERVRFLGIFSNNLDEFFRVRVANIRRRVTLDNARGSDSGAAQLLERIQSKVLNLQQEFDAIYASCLRELARHNIFLINERQMSEAQASWAQQYFKDKVKRHITPVVLDGVPNLTDVIADGLTYMMVALHKEQRVQYALIEIPSDKVARFVQLPHEKSKKRKALILIDNIIRYCIEDLFTGFFEFDRIECHAMKLTRDAEFDLSEDLDQSFTEKMSHGLKQRLTAAPVRFVYDREMPAHCLQRLINQLGIENTSSLIPGGRYHNFRDFISFPNPGRKYLEYRKNPAIKTRQFEDFTTVFEAISHSDVLLYYPYHRFSYLTEFLRQAAFDPAVRKIKINLYRVARNSRIIASLIDAVQNGKQVEVVIELKARFDEEANIEWSKELSEAGIQLSFGISNLKVHSKLMLIERVEEGQPQLYAHVGTGNFHEKTAKIYTDFALFTKDPRVTEEVSQVFDFVQRPYRPVSFNHLLVSPIEARDKILAMIDDEIAAASNKRKAEIWLKANNLVDDEIVERLYLASQAGVSVKILVRGMCALTPGVKGLSDKIRAISVVDRYLEHPRVMYFYAGGEQKLYITSADLMRRNLDLRVEVGCPIYHPELKKLIMDTLKLHWSDTTKARIIDAEQSNAYVARGNRKKIRSQEAIYEYLAAREQRDDG